MSAHAKLSPSSAKIWMSCPGMVRLAAGIEDQGSVFAAEGTAAHELAEQCLVESIDTPYATEASSKIGSWVAGYQVTEEMAEAVQVYLDYVDNNYSLEDEIKIEERLRLNDDIWGTADFIRYRPSTKELLVADYKHGAGVFVDVYQNPQALMYALMAAKNLGNRGIAKIRLAIIQPRCGGEPIREWEIDPNTLLEWEEEVMYAHNDVLKEDAPLKAGDHCKWCKAAGICPALAEIAQEEAKEEFSAGGDTGPEYLDGGELATRLEKLPVIETYIKAVKAEAYRRAMNAEELPGYKLVKKQPRRKWRDEAETQRFLKEYGLETEEIFSLKIKSPAQIDKIVGASGEEDVSDLWTKESSGLTLAPDDDKREAVTPGDAKNDFEPID